MTVRGMFGGYGLYCGETFFGIIFKGRLYLKTDETARLAYRQRGMKPFRPNATQTLSSYYEVPPDIIEDDGQLAAWAEQAIRVKIQGTAKGKRIFNGASCARDPWRDGRPA